MDMVDEPESQPPPSFTAQGKLAALSSGHVKEDQTKAIYCVAWSDDIRANVTDETLERSPSPNTASSSSPPPEDACEKSVTRYYRSLASCAGGRVTIYEVEVPNPASSDWKSHQRSSNFMPKQCYIDPDPDESYYACCFGGRSVGYYAAQLPPASTSCVKASAATPSTSSKPNCSTSTAATSNANDGEFRLPGNTNREEGDMDSKSSSQTGCIFDLEQDVYLGLLLDPNYELSGPQLLCVGGKGFAIKVIDTVRQKLLMTLSGHGEELAALKMSPISEWILLSASFDRSCRLWNLRNGSCIAYFAGHEGHKDIVMSCAWHPLGHRSVTGGHDTYVKIWDVGEETDVGRAIEQSFSVNLKANVNGTVEAETYVEPVFVHFPIHSTSKVHFQPVDCVEFIGDLILSKANDIMVLWDPDYTYNEGPDVTHRLPDRVTVLQEYKIKGVEPDFMYYRFGTTRSARTWAVGSQEGDVYVWDDNTMGISDLKLRITQNRQTVIRMVVFSPDDRILVCCCDDGGLWKWDLHRKASK